MAHAQFRSQGEARRYPSSPVTSNRYENRAPVNTVLCRNGPQCRKHQEGGTNHSSCRSTARGAKTVQGLVITTTTSHLSHPTEMQRKSSQGLVTEHMLTMSRAKKSLNVESPAFTPKPGTVQIAKGMSLSPKAVSAATFTPRGSGRLCFIPLCALLY